MKRRDLDIMLMRATGYSQQEIATKLGMGPSGVSYRLRKIRENKEHFGLKIEIFTSFQNNNMVLVPPGYKMCQKSTCREIYLQRRKNARKFCEKHEIRTPRLKHKVVHTFEGKPVKKGCTICGDPKHNIRTCPEKTPLE